MVCLLFYVSAAISDIDSDYTSDVNYPLPHNHHNNIPLHQLGGRKGGSLPPPTPSRYSEFDDNRIKNMQQDSLDRSFNEEFITEADFAPFYQDPPVNTSRHDLVQRNIENLNGGNPNTKANMGYDEYMEYDLDPKFQQQSYNHMNMDYEDGRQSPYRNANHNHWQMNGYDYREYDNGDDHIDGQDYLISSVYEPDTMYPDDSELKHEQRHNMDDRNNHQTHSPYRKVPVPPPRRNIGSSSGMTYDSDNKSSPYHERRSDCSSDPFYYNSCRPMLEDG